MERDSGNGHGWEGREDDWFAEKGELDWLGDPRENPAAVSSGESPARGQGGDAGGQRGQRAGPRGPDRESPRAARALMVRRRRRTLALAAVGLLAVTVIAVVVATSGGGSSTGTAPTASTPQPAPERTTGTAASPTTPVQTQPTATSTPAKVTLPASGKLGNGDSGSAVVTLQKALISLGFHLGTPDGDFGSSTQAAVASFQSAHGLTPDGIVGAATVQKLNALLASRSARG
jgi:hypothetical protein